MIDVKRSYLEHPDARRIYVGMAHPEAALAVLGALGFTAPESLGPGVGGVGIGTIMLDFGPGGVLGWLAGLADAQFADAVRPFDVEARALRTATRNVPLTKLEFGVMKYLDAHTGRVVTRDELLQNVWERASAAATSSMPSSRAFGGSSDLSVARSRRLSATAIASPAFLSGPCKRRISGPRGALAARDRLGRIIQELRPQRVTIQFETGGAGGGRGAAGGVGRQVRLNGPTFP